MGEFGGARHLARLAVRDDGAALGLILAIAAAVSWAKYFTKSSALRRIRAAPFARISDLRSLLADDDGDGRLVVVRGRVQADPGAALVAPESGDLAVVVRRTEKYLFHRTWGLLRKHYDTQFFGMLFPLKKIKEYSDSSRSVPFILVEGGQQPHSAHVHVSLDGSTQGLPLTTVYCHMGPMRPPWYSFFSFVFGSRYPVAMLTEESILPIGKEISAVGICTNRDGAIEIKSCMQLPFFLSDMTKVEIEDDLTNDAKIFFWGGIVLGTCSVCILSYAIIRNWQRLKGFWNGNHTQESSNEEQAQSDDLEDLPDAETCVICLTRRRTHAFLPCGHRLCCKSCALYVKMESSSPKCPFCRQPINSSIRIYNS